MLTKSTLWFREHFSGHQEKAIKEEDPDDDLTGSCCWLVPGIHACKLFLSRPFLLPMHGAAEYLPCQECNGLYKRADLINIYQCFSVCFDYCEIIQIYVCALNHMMNTALAEVESCWKTGWSVKTQHSSPCLLIYLIKMYFTKNSCLLENVS